MLIATDAQDLNSSLLGLLNGARLKGALAVVYNFSLKKRKYIGSDHSSLQVAKHYPKVLGLDPFNDFSVLCKIANTKYSRSFSNDFIASALCDNASSRPEKVPCHNSNTQKQGWRPIATAGLETRERSATQVPTRAAQRTVTSFHGHFCVQVVLFLRSNFVGRLGLGLVMCWRVAPSPVVSEAPALPLTGEHPVRPSEQINSRGPNISSMSYHLVEPLPSISHTTRPVTHTARGGAGNVISLKKTTVSSSQSTTSTGPAAALNNRPQVRFTGRTGAGNVHSYSERAIFSFDEELERQLRREKEVAPVFHVGRGGAGNTIIPEGFDLSRKCSRGSVKTMF
ncbi:predicted protein [Histoplasma mississippiense (nom. inval.)]|uniref:predicted protein n=1 Tax=Ajellomyces capsulatus (strain NAm1 / WU24) TaxID=2059318 RepID=UPI000157CCEF|nr:predicted protein [Histoplasma mississippiense (nom. inval.)]EDN10591.1 predicted protein [Histoplasma mississippiense (nom. inval.)]